MPLKRLKLFKSSKICFKMTKNMTPKTTEQNICFLNERIHFNLQCRFNEGGIKIQVLFSIGKCIEKHKLLRRSHPFHKDLSLLTLLFN